MLNKVTLFLLLLTVVVFTILVKLGLWQLDRAKDKSQQLTQIEARQTLAPLNMQQMQQALSLGSVTGYSLRVAVQADNTTIWLLDNQVYQGQVGYLAFQLLQVDDAQTSIFVELGFIAAPLRRDELPKVDPLSGSYTLEGRVYQKHVNPMSSALMMETTVDENSHVRFQNLNLVALAQTLDQPILPFVLQPNALANSLPQPWQPFPLSAQKHWGYALQWFSMAAVFAGLMLWQGFKYLRRTKSTLKTAQH